MHLRHADLHVGIKSVSAEYAEINTSNVTEILIDLGSVLIGHIKGPKDILGIKYRNEGGDSSKGHSVAQSKEVVDLKVKTSLGIVYHFFYLFFFKTSAELLIS